MNSLLAVAVCAVLTGASTFAAIVDRAEQLDKWEDRAYAYENQWWEEHKHLLGL